MDGDSEMVKDVGSLVDAISSSTMEDAPIQQVQSLCMRCGEDGVTTFCLTLIPHFRKILLSAFECTHCGERNNEVQFAGEIQERGSSYSLHVQSHDPKTLNRQVVKSEFATINIPELEFEIPPEAQRGTLSTVEGILVRATEELQALQEQRKKVDLNTAEAIDAFLVKLKNCASGNSPFTFILDDPTGNSFIENPFAPSTDPNLTVKYYNRTESQQAAMGYGFDQSNANQQPHGSVGSTASQRVIAQSNTSEIADSLCRYTSPEEVMTFPSTCGACSSACETRMFLTKIPYFQEVIVMASSCDTCGYRNSELKPGGRIPEKGRKITLAVKNSEDLSRDVIKSDTAGVVVPEVELELAPGTLGGMVTTVEGLIRKISESIERVHGFSVGDSVDGEIVGKWKEFKTRLLELLEMKMTWTLVIDDALANSFVAPACDDVADDSQLSFCEYERSWQQNEDLGLNDMDTSSADV